MFLSRTILGETVYIFIRGIKERVTIQSVVDRGSNNFCNVVSVSCLQVESYHGIIIFATGNMVGDLAMQYFGDFVEVTELKEDGKLDLGKMIERTKEEIEKGTNNICEASFSEGGLYCAVDILHKNPYGWDIIEVKSSTGVHPVYYEDMTYQLYVLRKAGLNITGVYNMHLNSNYVRKGELDLKQLFVLEDCTEICTFKLADVQDNIDNIVDYLDKTGDVEPVKDIDMCCEEPYK